MGSDQRHLPARADHQAPGAAGSSPVLGAAGGHEHGSQNGHRRRHEQMATQHQLGNMESAADHQQPREPAGQRRRPQWQVNAVAGRAQPDRRLDPQLA